jgi:type II secretory ATPase GspE/PulE/Tfp pilus assembly ATPase PilB-like protein
MLDMKAEAFLISSTLNLVIAQRLVRKLCPESREKYTLSPADAKDLQKYIDTDQVLKLLIAHKTVERSKKFEDIEFYRPKPSKNCPDGYSGRIGIYEILEVTETIKNLITSQTTADVIEERAKKEGMISMSEDGIIKAAQGITSIEEVLRVTLE